MVMKRLIIASLTSLATLAGCITNRHAAPESPEDQIRSFVEATSKGNVKEVFARLPPSYRNDISKGIAEFGDFLGPVLWKDIMATLADAGDMLYSKSDMIVELLDGNFGDIPTNEIASIITTAGQDLQRVPGKISYKMIKKGKVESILSLEELAIVPDRFLLMAKLGIYDDYYDTVDSVAVDSNGVAVATISNPNHDGTREVAFIEVEGCWIPESKSERWMENLADWRAMVAKLEMTPQRQQQSLNMLKYVRALVANAKQAQTAAEFKKTFDEATLAVFLGLIALGQPEFDFEEDF